MIPGWHFHSESRLDLSKPIQMGQALSYMPWSGPHVALHTLRLFAWSPGHLGFERGKESNNGVTRESVYNRKSKRRFLTIAFIHCYPSFAETETGHRRSYLTWSTLRGW